METQSTIESVLLGFGVYLTLGLLFAVPFLIAGAKRIDPVAGAGSWGFRVLIIPGVVWLWPFLLRRWISGVREPSEERNAHRKAANTRNMDLVRSIEQSLTDGEEAS